eukprot:4865726-Lingulodinium_polyedra.AAC.1
MAKAPFSRPCRKWAGRGGGGLTGRDMAGAEAGGPGARGGPGRLALRSRLECRRRPEGGKGRHRCRHSL